LTVPMRYPAAPAATRMATIRNTAATFPRIVVKVAEQDIDLLFRTA